MASSNMQSQILLEVRPIDISVDLNTMKQNIFETKINGLVWGTSMIKEIGYGINSLLISGIVDDTKVSPKDIENIFLKFEDVSNFNINLWNKIDKA